MDVYMTISRETVRTMAVEDAYALAFILLMCLGGMVALWVSSTTGRATRRNRHRTL